MSDFISANKAHFDAMATKNDEKPQSIKLAKRVASKILSLYPFNEESTTVLDFACGTGLVSRELAPYCMSVLGVDISQGMVDQYNLRVRNQGIPETEMNAMCSDFLGYPDAAIDALGGRKFDVVVCSMSYHHFESINDATKILARHLQDNGALFVADYQVKQTSGILSLGSCTRFSHIVPHLNGFTSDDIRSAFCDAGLSEESFSWHVIVEDATLHDRSVSIFLAGGRK